MADILTYGEQALLRLIADGNEKAYKVLFERYWPSIYVNIVQFTKNKEMAKDLAQDVFCRIWVVRDQLIHVTNFRGYLYSIARNIVVDELRKRIIGTVHERYLDTIPENEEHSPDRVLDIKQLSARIDNIIDGLPAQVKTAYQLKRIHGLSHDEIAGRMNISAVTSRSYVARAVVAIKAQLLPLLMILLSSGR